METRSRTRPYDDDSENVSMGQFMDLKNFVDGELKQINKEIKSLATNMEMQLKFICDSIKQTGSIRIQGSDDSGLSQDGGQLGDPKPSTREGDEAICPVGGDEDRVQEIPPTGISVQGPQVSAAESLLVTELRSSRIRAPQLTQLNKKLFKKFRNDFNYYKLQGGPLKMAALIGPTLLEQIAHHSGVQVFGLIEAEDVLIQDMILRFLSSSSIAETMVGLRALRMTGTSNLDFEGYVQDFQFEIQCSGKYKLPDRVQTNIFVEGLRPEILIQTVKSMEPMDLDQAIILARDFIKDFTEAEKKMKYFMQEAAGGRGKAKDTIQETKSSSKENVGKRSSTEINNQNDFFAFNPHILCTKCYHPGHPTEYCRTSTAKYWTKEAGLTRQRELVAKLKRDDAKPTPAPAPATKAKKVSVTQGSPAAPIVATTKILEVSLRADVAEGEEPLINTKGAHVQGTLAGTELTCSVLLDTGASANFISDTIFNQLPSVQRETFREVRGEIRLAEDGPPRRLSMKQGKIVLNLLVPGGPLQLELVVLVYGCGEDIVLSLQTMQQHSLFHLLELSNQSTNQVSNSLELEPEVAEHLSISDLDTFKTGACITNFGDIIDPDYPYQEELLQLLNTYQDLFQALDSDSFIKVEPIVLRLRPGATFKNFHPRRVNPRLLELLRKELDTLLEMGYIYPCESPMASPIVLVPKSGGGVRLCVDYKVWLNSILEEVRYPLPHIGQLLSHLQEFKFFFRLDLTRGFHQLRVSKESQYLTAFICPFGTYAFTRLPFGINMAPMFFQKVMQDILQPVQHHVVGHLIDDVVGGVTLPELLIPTLDAIFSRLREFGVKLNGEKCRFGAQVLEVLGYLASSEGVRMTDKRKSSIESIPSPTSVKLLRRFLGMTNYFKKFIPNYAGLIKPLTASTHIFSWGSEQEKAFTEVKAAVTKTGLLHHLNYELPIILRVDASQYGVGGILLNVTPEGEEHIVSFLSTAFSGAAQRWSVIEKEAYAAVYCLIELEPVLLGVPFILETDHRNLMWLQKAVAPKLVRWRLRLQAFDFVVKHIPGQSNIFADELSRIVRSSAVDDITVLASELHVIYYKDDICSRSIEDIMGEFHNSVVGHKGAATTLAQIRRAGYEWPAMAETVAHFITTCPTCQKIRKHEDARSPPLLNRTILEPFLCIAMDSVGPLPVSEEGYQHIQVLIDEFSKVTFLFPTKSTSALEAVACINSVTGRVGAIQTIMSDRGSQYVNEVMDAYCDFWGIRHRMSLAYRPQSNGIVERTNQEVLRHLRGIVFDKRVLPKWSQYLPMVERIINSSYHSGIGTAPIRVLYGDIITLDRGLLTAWRAEELAEEALARQPTSTYIRQLTDQLQAIAAASLKHQAKEIEKRRRRVKPDGEARTFVEGDFVLVSYPVRPPSKLSPRWRGPFLILERKNNTYICQDLLTNTPQEFDVSRLTPWEDRENPGVDPGEVRREAALRDREEFVVDSIVDHRGNSKKKSSLEFKIRWLGYSPEEDSWIPYSEAKDLEALDVYLMSHPELKL